MSPPEKDSSLSLATLPTVRQLFADAAAAANLLAESVIRGLADLAQRQSRTLRRATFKQSNSGKIFLQVDLQSSRPRKPPEPMRIQQSPVDVRRRLRELRPR